MNILHVVNISFVIPYFLGKQLNYFVNKGYKEYVICSPAEELETFAKTYGFEYVEVDVLRKISIWKDLKAVMLTMNYISKKCVNVVVGHTPKGALIAMLAAYMMRVPVRIYFRHGLVYETSRGIKRKILIFIDRIAAKLATKVVCVSPSVCIRSLEDKLNSSSKQILLSKGTCNGIDVNKFSRVNVNEEILGKLRDKYGIRKSNFVIGFTGRLVKDKGVIELVYAFNRLRKEHSDMLLLLVGMLEERDALPFDVVDSIKDNPSIVSIGYVENSVIEYYYALMDLFVLPSYREGFPTSVLEASSMELPIITTKVTGCIDAIVENETGVFVEHNADSLAESVDMFYNDRNRCATYGKKGRIFVEQNFEQNMIWSEIEKLYCK